MKRRTFIQNSAALSAFAGISTTAFGASQTDAIPSNAAKFKLKYGPGFGSFPELAGKDPIEVIKWCSDQGFRAMFDLGLPNYPIDKQEKVMAELARQNMDMGPFLIHADFSKESMVLRDPESREMLRKKVLDGVEVFKRTGVKWGLMVPGKFNLHMAWEYQTANVIDNMRELSEIAEKAGMTIVLEPLNKQDHPGLFLTGMPQTYAICRAVNSPACKINDDLYHQQITEGNIITNMETSWSEIASFHIGDTPGRKEPGTGEMNYRNIFKFIHNKGYDGVLCMEHGRSIAGKEGELALLESYRIADNF